MRQPKIKKRENWPGLRTSFSLKKVMNASPVLIEKNTSTKARLARAENKKLLVRLKNDGTSFFSFPRREFFPIFLPSQEHFRERIPASFGHLLEKVKEKKLFPPHYPIFIVSCQASKPRGQDVIEEGKKSFFNPIRSFCERPERKYQTNWPYSSVSKEVRLY